jgi:membrane fusion protein, multidrug efflux system
MPMNDQPAPESFADAEPVNAKRGLPRPLIVGAIALVALVLGILWIRMPGSTASTDNAYLRADMTVISPRVRGLVADVLVTENAVVKAGTPLVRIDSQEFDAKLSSARADLAVARAAVSSAEAALGRLGAEQGAANANVATAATMIRAADAEAARARADQARLRALLRQGFATKRTVDAADAQAIAATAESARARAALTGQSAQAGVTTSRRGELIAALAQARATRDKAAAALALAEQDKGYTVITAPVDGVVGNRQAQIGMFVQPGSRLMMLVPARGTYVIANFKETQTSRMLAGQKATNSPAISKASPLRQVRNSPCCRLNRALATSPKSSSASACGSRLIRGRRGWNVCVRACLSRQRWR